MALHLIKLAVGCESVKDLKKRVAERARLARQRGGTQRHVHVTRMVPKRDEELLAGGSLYWVIRGEIAAREKLIGTGVGHRGLAPLARAHARRCP